MATIVNFQLPISNWSGPDPLNRQSAIGNLATHPLPRGGTDFIRRSSLLASHPAQLAISQSSGAARY